MVSSWRSITHSSWPRPRRFRQTQCHRCHLPHRLLIGKPHGLSGPGRGAKGLAVKIHDFVKSCNISTYWYVSDIVDQKNEDFN